MALVLGIDPGADGGLALVGAGGKLVMTKPMPMAEMRVGKTNRRRTDETELRYLLCFFVMDMTVDLVMMERTQSQRAGGGALMEHSGLVRGMLAMLPVRVELIDAATWKRVMKAPKDKEQATARAEAIFPDHNGQFRGPRGGKLDGLAEASMIAQYGHLAVLQLKGAA